MKQALVWPAGALATGIFVLSLGAVDIPFTDVLRWAALNADRHTTVLIETYRAPRTLAAAMVGAHFAVAGMILQIVLRNPLADPTIFGVSGGAALAVVASMTVAVSFAAPEAGVIVVNDYLPMELIPFIALFGAMAATAVMLVLSWDGGFRPKRMALTGVVLGAVLSAIVMAGVLSLPEAQTQLAVLWLAGSLYARDMTHVWTILPWTLIGLTAAALLVRPLSVLRFDVASAASQGVGVASMRFFLVVISSALAASAVAIAGPVGFVGLLAPHVVRRIASSGIGAQLWTNIWAGAILVMLADGLGRAVLGAVEVPVGIMTSLIGAPFLIYLLGTERKAS